MIYLSAQPAEFYFKWQIEVLLNNFSRLGIKKQQIHILFSYKGKVDDRIISLIKEYQEIANFFFYEDKRYGKSYISTIRPHIIKQHFNRFPNLQFETIFYHDSDIIFREVPLFGELIKNSGKKVWFMSDADFYIGSTLLNYFNTNILLDLCKLVNVDYHLLLQSQNIFGGAQYLMQNVPLEFWVKHEHDSEAIFNFLNAKYETYRQQRFDSTELEDTSYNVDFSSFQPWCSDMWSMILNTLFFGYQIRIDKELDFCWATDTIDKWYTTKIFHNAGVTINEAHNTFYKENYRDYSPFNTDFSYINQNKCSFKYVEEIKNTIRSKRYSNQKVTLFIMLEITSSSQLALLSTFLMFIDKYFNLETVFWEIGSSRKFYDNHIVEDLDYQFWKGESSYTETLNYFAKFSKKVTKQTVLFFNKICFLHPNSLIEAIKYIEKKYSVVFPFNKAFSINKRLKNFNIFTNTLNFAFFKNNYPEIKSDTKSTPIIVIDIESYRSFHEVSLEFNIEDIDLYFIVKALLANENVMRLEGSVYESS